jgi:TPR repeat protein
MLTGLIAALAVVQVSPAAAAYDKAMAACAGGDAAACRKLAARILERDSQGELARFAPAFIAGCGKSVADACAGLGMAETSGAGIAADKASGERHLVAACARGSSIACARTSEWRMQSSSDEAGRQQIFAEAAAECDKLAGSVCFAVAGFWHAGSGTPKDDAQATRLTRKACDTGAALACVSAGLDLGGDRAKRDEARALFEKACAGDSGFGCGLLGGITKPPGGPAARALYLRGCDLGEPRTCDMLAGADEASQRKACDLGGAESCSLLAFKKGVAIEHGGKPEEMEGVLKLLRRGCSRGSTRGCNVLGRVSKEAIDACDQGDARACQQAGFVHAMGTSMPKDNGPSYAADPAKARAAFAKACKGGVKAACARAK